MPESFSPRDITCAILSGGFGTRLKSILSEVPKVMAPVLNRPFITYLLDQLLHAGFRKVVLCVGYKADLIQETFGKNYKDLLIAYSQEDRPLGTAGALRLALPMLASNTVLIMNGDSFVDEDLPEFVTWFGKSPREAALIAAKMEDTSRFGRIVLGPEDTVLGFEEKKLDAGPGFINAGVYLLRRRVIEDLPPERSVSLEREIMPNLIGKGFFAYCSRSRFIDIGIPESFSEAQVFFKESSGQRNS